MVNVILGLVDQVRLHLQLYLSLINDHTPEKLLLEPILGFHFRDVVQKGFSFEFAYSQS